MENGGSWIGAGIVVMIAGLGVTYALLDLHGLLAWLPPVALGSGLIVKGALEAGNR